MLLKKADGFLFNAIQYRQSGFLRQPSLHDDMIRNVEHLEASIIHRSIGILDVHRFKYSFTSSSVRRSLASPKYGTQLRHSHVVRLILHVETGRNSLTFDRKVMLSFCRLRLVRKHEIIYILGIHSTQMHIDGRKREQVIFRSRRIKRIHSL